MQSLSLVSKFLLNSSFQEVARIILISNWSAQGLLVKIIKKGENPVRKNEGIYRMIVAVFGDRSSGHLRISPGPGMGWRRRVERRNLSRADEQNLVFLQLKMYYRNIEGEEQ